MNLNKSNPIDDEIDAIRVNLYEQTKDMTEDERIAFFNRSAREILKEYGVSVKVVETPGADAIQLQR